MVIPPVSHRYGSSKSPIERGARAHLACRLRGAILQEHEQSTLLVWPCHHSQHLASGCANGYHLLLARRPCPPLLPPAVDDAAAGHLQFLDLVEAELLLVFAGPSHSGSPAQTMFPEKYGPGREPDFQNPRQRRGCGPGVAVAGGEEVGSGGGGFRSTRGGRTRRGCRRRRRRRGGEVKGEARGRASVMEPPEAWGREGGAGWGLRG